MDNVDKMDCRANGEVIFFDNEPSTVPRSKDIRSDQSEDRVDRKKAWVRCAIIQTKNNEMS